MSASIRRRVLLLIAAGVIVLSADAGAAQASLAPVKLVETGHFPEGFEFTHGVAVNNDASSVEHGDVYVVDTSNHRVQVFTATGTFVEMFGREVDKGKPGNVCKAGEECQAGLEGSEAGQFSTPLGIASDPSNGDVYVDELAEGAERVQAFTDEGQFLFEIGREVNTTAAQKNVCTQAEIASCVAPKPSEGSAEEGVFNIATFIAPNILAAGGPKDLLFVGDENRVQEFNATTGAPAKQQVPTQNTRVVLSTSFLKRGPNSPALRSNLAHKGRKCSSLVSRSIPPVVWRWGKAKVGRLAAHCTNQRPANASPSSLPLLASAGWLSTTKDTCTSAKNPTPQVAPKSSRTRPSRSPNSS